MSTARKYRKLEVEPLQLFEPLPHAPAGLKPFMAIEIRPADSELSIFTTIPLDVWKDDIWTLEYVQMCVRGAGV